MNFFKKVPNINFIRLSRTTIIISLIIIFSGIASLVVRGGPRYGTDFAGGLVVRLKFTKSVNIEDVRTVLGKIGLGDSIIQKAGGEEHNEVLISTKKTDSELNRMGDRITKALATSGKFDQNKFEVLKIDMVGPRAGKELRKKGILACFWAIVVMLVYIAWRFELPFALGAIIAEFHDLLIVIGIFSLLNKEFDIGILAALLTILGYSVNDTIVIFDRVRENLRFSKTEGFEPIVNRSINECLGRTLLTSTILLPLISMFFFGGAVLHDMSLALIIGMVSGTYSSDFIAAPFVVWWDKYKTNKEKAIQKGTVAKVAKAKAAS